MRESRSFERFVQQQYKGKLIMKKNKLIQTSIISLVIGLGHIVLPETSFADDECCFIKHGKETRLCVPSDKNMCDMWTKAIIKVYPEKTYLTGNVQKGSCPADCNVLNNKGKQKYWLSTLAWELSGKKGPAPTHWHPNTPYGSPSK